MASKIVFLLISLIFCYVVTSVRSDCKESYVMFCDCVTDIQNYRSTNWTDVIIDATNFSCSSALDGKTFESLEEIKLLFVVNHITNIERSAFKTIGGTLKFLKLYGNHLNHLKTSSFSGFRKLSQLSLVNNDIQQIDPFTFRDSQIKNLDLSRNKLETIIENAFAGGKITKIKLRYNKLSYINDDAFNEHLEVLKLDYNNLEYIQPGFAKSFPQLKELSISHNKLSQISNIKHLEKIRKLDFSFNNINSVDGGEFEDLKNLDYLDLSCNKLEMFSLKYFKKIKAERMTLLLAYNLLTNLKVEDVKPMTVTLFGNPWNCKCLSKIEQKMHEYNFTTTKCDLELFKMGSVPICIEQGECKSDPVENRGDLRRFSQYVNTNPNQLECDLFHNVGEKYIVSVRSP